MLKRRSERRSAPRPGSATPATENPDPKQLRRRTRHYPRATDTKRLRRSVNFPTRGLERPLLSGAENVPSGKKPRLTYPLRRTAAEPLLVPLGRAPSRFPFLVYPRRWCSREDSNLHRLPHMILSHTRLPIPPREPVVFVSGTDMLRRS